MNDSNGALLGGAQTLLPSEICYCREPIARHAQSVEQMHSREVRCVLTQDEIIAFKLVDQAHRRG